MTMGKGEICSCSTRQKINTKSSTETEVVAVADLLPMLVLMSHFLRAQGYSTTALLDQNNTSAIQMETNG